MNLLLLGLTIGTIGKLILGISVMRVHIHIIHEHRIDSVVLKSLKREHIVTIIGLALIVIGYALEVYFYSNATDLLTCTGEACAAAVGSSLFN